MEQVKVLQLARLPRSPAGYLPSGRSIAAGPSSSGRPGHKPSGRTDNGVGELAGGGLLRPTLQTPRSVEARWLAASSRTDLPYQNGGASGTSRAACLASDRDHRDRSPLLAEEEKRGLELLTQHLAASLPFFAGPLNHHAVAVLEQFQRSFQTSQDPDVAPLLVLTGPHGVGKTRLAESLAADWQNRNSKETLRIESGRTFVRSLGPLQYLGRTHEFTDDYTTAGLFVLDGLEALLPRKGALALFRQTLDRRNELRLPTIVTSLGLSPGKIPFAGSPPAQGLAAAESCRVDAGMAARLDAEAVASRLRGGLVIPVYPPCVATKRVLVGKIAELLGLSLAPEALDLLAQQLPGSVPLVLQQMARLAWSRSSIPQVSTAANEISLKDCQAWLKKDTINHAQQLKQLVLQVAVRLGLKAADLCGQGRLKTAVEGRGIVALLGTKELQCTFQQIGNVLGGRDRTTVMHAVNRTTKRLLTDPPLARLVEETRIWLHQHLEELETESLSPTQMQKRRKSKSG